MSLDAYLTSRPGRCSGCGCHVATQGCRCAGGEWSLFVAALRASVREDGTVHACDVRPLVRGRIEPKHIGSSWRKARQSGLITEVGHERSDDEQGRNAGRMEPYYRWNEAA